MRGLVGLVLDLAHAGRDGLTLGWLDAQDRRELTGSVERKEADLANRS